MTTPNSLNDFFFDARPERLVTPATRAAPLTVSDTVEVSEIPRSIVAAVSGTVTMKLRDDTTARVYELLAGVVYPYRPRQIMDTGTDADLGILGLY